MVAVGPSAPLVEPAIGFAFPGGLVVCDSGAGTVMTSSLSNLEWASD
jgi:hypothetical protein